jgi:S1-C subfamily serine protease
MRYGDVILSVNGQRTASAEEFVEARNLRQDGAELVVFRDGREITLDIPFEAERKPITEEQIHEAAVQAVAARIIS